jgi:hypothetical protein
VKKYADGGMTQQPTYPFYGNQPQAGGQNGGMNQTFNMQPQANVDPNQQQPKMFKEGWKSFQCFCPCGWLRYKG